jgi:hypothetical protein
MILKQQEHIAIVDFARKRIDAALAVKYVSVQRTHLPLKMNFAHDTVFTGAYHDHHTYPRHMATTPSRMAAKPTQQKRLLPKTQSQTYHVLQMGKQTLRQNNTHLT